MVVIGWDDKIDVESTLFYNKVWGMDFCLPKKHPWFCTCYSKDHQKNWDISFHQYTRLSSTYTIRNNSNKFDYEFCVLFIVKFIIFLLLYSISWIEPASL